MYFSLALGVFAGLRARLPEDNLSALCLLWALHPRKGLLGLSGLGKEESWPLRGGKQSVDQGSHPKSGRDLALP